MHGPVPSLALWRRIVLAAALVCFVLPVLAGPLDTVCLCLGGDVPVAAGGCCCDPGADAPVQVPDDADDDVCCDDDRPGCVDLHAADDPAVRPERAADPLPDVAPAVALTAAPCVVPSPATTPRVACRAPPFPAASPPPRLRVLRC